MEQVQPGKTFLGRLAHDGDLLEELNAFCAEHGIRHGRVEAIGAVKKARLGYYNQATREYEFHECNEPMEITNLTGNVSLKDSQPFVHAHVTLTDKAGRAFGGHLAPGTIVFACEALVQELEGPDFHRAFDEPTGLPLWEMK
ncbi:MAG: DNA-binding protein [Phycisphaerae bacterium]|nr:DNA-binding protein [Phycisphaerae bacterium]